jgi:PLP dependent protein
VPLRTDLAARLDAVHARISAAARRAGRDPADVRVVAVTKTFDVPMAQAAYALGLRDFGENRVQEAAAKIPQLPDDVRWHLIGHLQTNKASRAAPLFSVVHSIDSDRIAAGLSARRPDDLPNIDVLVEVELTGIAGHTGVPISALDSVVASVARLPRLSLRGLMTMAPPAPDESLARPTFARLRALRDDLSRRLGIELPELSMGMSDDFGVAVEEGATIVRLGRALFGPRAPKGA